MMARTRSTTANGWRLSSAPAFKHRVRGGAKMLALYEDCYKAWYVGLIDDWYHGTRSDDDPTIIWQIDGIEIEPAILSADLAAKRAEAGIASLDWGGMWCGYRGLIVTYTDGRRIEERYNGWAVEVRELAS